jgi:hypothetical protein
LLGCQLLFFSLVFLLVWYRFVVGHSLLTF